jgi:hypothetical protein
MTSKKPKHWINLTAMGKSSMVSFKTADYQSWQKIITELKKLAEPTSLKSETSDIAQKYLISKYRVETYEPANGVNLNLNDLFEVIVMSKQ